MSKKKGSLSINSENIFPIIKKWLYSDHDIFFRELVSNGCDAITKLKKLEMMGEAEIADDEEFKIQILANPKEKTLTFIDNGLGMTADEVDEYINQIAFSGAEAFLEQYKDKTSEDQIIGHFGLGFYSAFMVADKVEIDTLSYKKDAKAVKWVCDGGIEYEIGEGKKPTRGTIITLHVGEEGKEFLNSWKLKEILAKYCYFMPTEIYFEDVEEVKKAEEERAKKLAGNPDTAPVEEAPKPVNDTTPLWLKKPSECTDEEYISFYHKVFTDFNDPLFWIHLSMDYPFRLKGILYFPKLKHELDSVEGQVKLYNNQVFIADNIKEVIPEFLMLLKGVIDCPDLPLNVSRSALQNDGFVKKISDYITKKVADKLSGMCKTDKEEYEKYWDDISPFIKFGCLKDTKFCEKMSDYVLFKNLDDKYLTFKECLEENKDKHENTIFYTNDPVQQSQYVNMFKAEGIDAVVLKDAIDQPFISQLEQKNENVKFVRIDADLNDSFTEEISEDELKDATEKLTETFKKALNRDQLDVKVQKIKDEKVSSMITVSEESRRMQDMMKMYGMSGMDPAMFGGSGETLVLNANNALVKYILANPEGENTDIMCKQLYDLAVISHTPLNPESMTAFIERSNKILEILSEK